MHCFELARRDVLDADNDICVRASGHKHLRPKSIHDPDILETFGDAYMYFACIRFINSVSPGDL